MTPLGSFPSSALINILTLLHVSKIIILTLILRGRLICESANIRVCTVYIVLGWRSVKKAGILMSGLNIINLLNFHYHNLPVLL